MLARLSMSGARLRTGADDVYSTWMVLVQWLVDSDDAEWTSRHGQAVGTNDVLVSARRIYESVGFVLSYQESHHSFGHDLVGQHWIIDLQSVIDDSRTAD